LRDEVDIAHFETNYRFRRFIAPSEKRWFENIDLVSYDVESKVTV